MLLHSTHPLEFLFHPRSIAIVGASNNPRNSGRRYLEQLQHFGFKGDLYPVNPNVSEVLRLKAYPSVTEIPSPVDFVISCIPAQMALPLMEECVAKGVKAVHYFTARLSETGLPERKAMEEELVQIARRGGVRIVGPNCMGLHYSESGLSFRFDLPQESGPIGFISQSGRNTVELVHRGSGRGLSFSKIVSYGNGCDLNECDFLDYFLHDPETELIAAYIEGVKDGRRFFKVLREVASKKPVIILKGGQTGAGARAVASHTASLAGNFSMWEIACRQAGAINVADMEELADMTLAFLLLSPVQGRRIAVMGGGGGGSVGAADVCERAGLIVPPLPDEIKRELRAIAPEVWTMIGNPIDSSATDGQTTFIRAAELLAADKDIDLLMANPGAEWSLDQPENRDDLFQSLEMFINLGKSVAKPMVFILPPGDFGQPWKSQIILELQEVCVRAGYPVYPTIARAAHALSKFVWYHERRG
ncbi:MAG: CoA-binding protein [Candidatus Tectomicrobia bacterium]|nr:CoA-binding protein [Candidatus Tectomicrobia bacterium]